jgi:hypothetical protein
MAHQPEFEGTPHFITQEESEQQMKEAQEILDKDLLTAEEVELRARYDTVVESFVNGKYCPKCTVSTNIETEYVTLVFQDLKFTATSIQMTKKSFNEFIQKLQFFNGLPTTGQTRKQILND